MNQLTRRQLLAAVGVAGVGTGLAGAGLARATARDPPYTRYTYAQAGDSSENRLRIAWYEQYNGQFVESTDDSGETDRTAVVDPDAAPTYVNNEGPVIGLDGVIPGDEGNLVVGLEAVDIEGTDEGVDVWLRVVLNDDLENGVNEPESLAAGEDDPIGAGSGDDAGNDPPGTGELGEALQLTVWKDGGFVGGCDGGTGPDVGETTLAEDSLAAISASGDLGEGVRVIDCLEQGAARCVSFYWQLPDEVGNHIQGDSVDFDIEFIGQDCGDGNPWGGQ